MSPVISPVMSPVSDVFSNLSSDVSVPPGVYSFSVSWQTVVFGLITVKKTETLFSTV